MGKVQAKNLPLQPPHPSHAETKVQSLIESKGHGLNTPSHTIRREFASQQVETLN